MILRTAVVISTLLFLSCASPKSLQLDGSGTDLELDMYSGRPNPVWQLTAAEVSELEARFADLRASSASTPEHLGYRGFILRARSGQDIRVYAGSIFVENKVYADVHDAEAWLIAFAERKGVKVRRK